jgi:hypothetical protein
MWWDVRLSMVQLYGNSLTDLLTADAGAASQSSAPGKPLTVSSADHGVALIAAGRKSRSTAATAMNVASSRSHCLVRLRVTVTSLGAPAATGDLSTAAETSGSLSVVDLAGSERAHRSGSSGVRLTEACAINRGVAALGNVVCALARRSSHVPWRDSTLTRLLRPLLAGRCLTTLLLCVAPSAAHANETTASLELGARAAVVRVRATCQQRDIAGVDTAALDSAQAAAQATLPAAVRSKPSAASYVAASRIPRSGSVPLRRSRAGQSSAAYTDRYRDHQRLNRLQVARRRRRHSITGVSLPNGERGRTIPAVVPSTAGKQRIQRLRAARAALQRDGTERPFATTQEQLRGRANEIRQRGSMPEAGYFRRDSQALSKTVLGKGGHGVRVVSRSFGRGIFHSYFNDPSGHACAEAAPALALGSFGVPPSTPTARRVRFTASPASSSDDSVSVAGSVGITGFRSDVSKARSVLAAAPRSELPSRGGIASAAALSSRESKPASVRLIDPMLASATKVIQLSRVRRQQWAAKSSHDSKQPLGRATANSRWFKARTEALAELGMI